MYMKERLSDEDTTEEPLDKNPLAHAELIAIKKASKKMGRLEIGRLYIVCDIGIVSDVLRSHCAGANEKSCSWLYESKSRVCRVYLNLLQVEQFNHQVELEIGVLQEECSLMMKNFFKELRKAKQKH